jgi:hypothetical protein
MQGHDAYLRMERNVLDREGAQGGELTLVSNRNPQKRPLKGLSVTCPRRDVVAARHAGVEEANGGPLQKKFGMISQPRFDR